MLKMAIKLRLPKTLWLTLFSACLLPLLFTVWDGFNDLLGANPIEEITQRSGDWALRMLLITLAATPARRLFGWRWPLRMRRMFGLFAFFYASLHFLTYLVLDQFFDWAEIFDDILKRPYISIGFGAFILLLPLAITSIQSMQRRLGKRWGQLHQLIYVIAVLGILHYFWLVKADYRQALIHAAVLLALLLVRVYFQRQGASSR
jgi:methionine sulfoxide reductase heme-binding subunit